MSLECLERGVANSSSAMETSYLSLMSSHHRRQTPFLQLLLQGAMGVERAGEEGEEEEERLHSQYLLPSYPSESQFQLFHLQGNHGKWNRTAGIDVFSAAAAPVPVEQLESCISHASESQSDAGRLGHDPNEKEVEIIMAPAPAPRAKKKRKRARASESAKKPEEVETQRLTHIAVERNRRRLMNDHLAALRSLIPPSFVQRGDQASIIGGAIEFVKELEQLLLSLQAQNRIRTAAASSFPCTGSGEAHEPAQGGAALDGFFLSPQYTTYSQQRLQQPEGGEEMAAAFGVDVEAKVVQGHVSLKVAGPRRAGQLTRAIAAMEELRLSVLHLNITSLDQSSVLYSLNLKMEEDCRLGSADEVAAAVHQLFVCINACC